MSHEWTYILYIYLSNDGTLRWEENNIEILTKKELSEILGVSIKAIRNIENRNTLSKRLKDKGYNFIERIKDGRSYKYKIEKINDNKKTLNDICVTMFNTNDDEKFGDYYLYRVFNHESPIPSKLLSDKVGVNQKTIYSWDKNMIDNGMMSKDGHFYIAVDYINNKQHYRLTDIYEYNSYIRNSRFAKKKKDIAFKYKKGEITYEEMEMMLIGINEYAKTIECKFVYRINKFNIIKSNLLNDIFKLCLETRTDKNKKYGIRFIEELNGKDK